MPRTGSVWTPARRFVPRTAGAGCRASRNEGRGGLPAIRGGPSGDCEGLLVSILESGAAGLPVVSTWHAGIPEAIIEGETGIRVDEHDVTGMTTAMSLLLHDAELVERLGQSARERVRIHFAIDNSIARLWAILESCSSPRSANLQPLIADARCETA